MGRYPSIKIVDLGNALSYNRHINTFEVQSLYYRAPEVLFGHSMSAAIDLWSVGCILFELTKITNSKQTKNSSKTTGRHHHALFACRNGIELAQKIRDTLSAFPIYVYNEYNACYYTTIVDKLQQQNTQKVTHSNVCYSDLKRQQIKTLIAQMDASQTEFDDEMNDFLDLIAGLLDLNPSTRQTSDEAISQSFCINVKYVKSDAVVLSCLQHNFESVYPVITIASDEQRQARIDAQMTDYKYYESIKQKKQIGQMGFSALPIPREMAITKNKAPYVNHDYAHRIAHNKVHCLLHGCCGAEPPFKKMKLTKMCG